MQINLDKFKIDDKIEEEEKDNEEDEDNDNKSVNEHFDPDEISEFSCMMDSSGSSWYSVLSWKVSKFIKEMSKQKPKKKKKRKNNLVDKKLATVSLESFHCSSCCCWVCQKQCWSNLPDKLTQNKLSCQQISQTSQSPITHTNVVIDSNYHCSGWANLSRLDRNFNQNNSKCCFCYCSSYFHYCNIRWLWHWPENAILNFLSLTTLQHLKSFSDVNYHNAVSAPINHIAHQSTKKTVKRKVVDKVRAKVRTNRTMFPMFLLFFVSIFVGFIDANSLEFTSTNNTNSATPVILSNQYHNHTSYLHHNHHHNISHHQFGVRQKHSTPFQRFPHHTKVTHVRSHSASNSKHFNKSDDNNIVKVSKIFLNSSSTIPSFSSLPVSFNYSRTSVPTIDSRDIVEKSNEFNKSDISNSVGGSNDIYEFAFTVPEASVLLSFASASSFSPSILTHSSQFLSSSSNNRAISLNCTNLFPVASPIASTTIAIPTLLTRNPQNSRTTKTIPDQTRHQSGKHQSKRDLIQSLNVSHSSTELSTVSELSTMPVNQSSEVISLLTPTYEWLNQSNQDSLKALSYQSSVIGSAVDIPENDDDVIEDENEENSVNIFNQTSNKNSKTKGNRTMKGEIQNTYSLPWKIQLMWCVIFGTMITVGLVANCLVLATIGGHKSLHTVTNCFLLNLTVSDLVTLLFNATFNFVFMLNGHWPFGTLYCTVNNFFTNLTIAVSVFTIMVTSKERYNAIVHPLRKRMTKQRAFVNILLIWLGGTLFSVPTLVFSRTINVKKYDSDQIQRTLCLLKWPDGYPGQSHIDFLYNLLFLVLIYLLPLMTMAIAYTLMGRVLWGSKEIGESTQAQMNLVCSKQKIVRMLICVVVVFGVCWLPYQLYFLSLYQWPDLVSANGIQHIYLAIYWLAMSNSMFNPIILLLMNRRFRRYSTKLLNFWPLNRLLCCLLQAQQLLSSDTSPTTFTLVQGYSPNHQGHEMATTTVLLCNGAKQATNNNNNNNNNNNSNGTDGKQPTSPLIVRHGSHQNNGQNSNGKHREQNNHDKDKISVNCSNGSSTVASPNRNYYAPNSNSGSLQSPPPPLPSVVINSDSAGVADITVGGDSDESAQHSSPPDYCLHLNVINRSNNGSPKSSSNKVSTKSKTLSTSLAGTNANSNWNETKRNNNNSQNTSDKLLRNKNNIPLAHSFMSITN